MATKGILTDPGRVEGPLKHIKSLPQSDLPDFFFFKMAAKMTANTS